MLNRKYRLSYLPLFYEELQEKIMYIAETLENPQAANDLLDKVEAAILDRLPIALWRCGGFYTMAKTGTG